LAVPHGVLNQDISFVVLDFGCIYHALLGPETQTDR